MPRSDCLQQRRSETQYASEWLFTTKTIEAKESGFKNWYVECKHPQWNRELIISPIIITHKSYARDKVDGYWHIFDSKTYTVFQSGKQEGKREFGVEFIISKRWETTYYVLFNQNCCGIDLGHRALQSPRRKETVWNQDTMKKRVETRDVVSEMKGREKVKTGTGPQRALL